MSEDSSLNIVGSNILGSTSTTTPPTNATSVPMSNCTTVTSAPPQSNTSSKMDLNEILNFLRSNNLLDTEKNLRDELQRKTNSSNITGATNRDTGKVTADGSNVLSSYESDDNPSLYLEVYQDLLRFVESSLDLYRHELALILYPVFVHMYLELVYNCHEKEAKAFVTKYGAIQESFYMDDIKKLSFITKKQHMIGSELMENFQTSQFTVRMSRDSYSQLRQLRKVISEKKHSVIWNIIQEHLFLDIYEGIARNKNQIDATSGGMIGEANRQANRIKVFYGLLKDPDLTGFLNIEDDYEADGEGKPKKKKLRKDIYGLKKLKNDPNAPQQSRMHFPELRDCDKAEKAKALKEAGRRQQLSSESLPSACFYSVINAAASLSANDISDDSSLLALGFTSGLIRICSLSPSKLKALRSASELNDLDPDTDDILHRMNENTADVARNMPGHTGAVYGLSISPDKQLVLSSSEDGTIRLWSLQTWTTLVVFKGHILPVWQVKFSPQGYYFASCGNDKTVRLWTTEQYNCVRLFVGHFSDVDCITFHPNCNYVASGSSDRSIRLWDCVNGNCVRLMTGHKGVVKCLTFSSDGRFLASGGSDNRVLLWDIAHGHLLGDFAHHTGMITHLSFSRESAILASASNDFSIALWDFSSFTSDLNLEEVNVTNNPTVNVDSSKYNLTTFYTKDTPFQDTHFSRRNLLIAIGSFI